MNNFLFLLVVFSLLSCDKKENEQVQEEQLVVHCERNNIVKFSKDEFIFIPNIYSPNADGICDLIYIKSKPKMTNLNFVLKNEKGEEVYTSNKDRTFIWCTPYDDKQSFTKDEKLTFELNCNLGNHIISKTGVITLARDPYEDSPLNVKYCDSCYFGDMLDTWNTDTFKLVQTSEIAICDTEP